MDEGYLGQGRFWQSYEALRNLLLCLKLFQNNVRQVIYAEFQKIGCVVDVFIPNKRTKSGKFAIVRFKNVLDKR